MIARIIAGSARNTMLVLIGTAFAVIADIYAVLHTPLDALPDLSDTQVIEYALLAKNRSRLAVALTTRSPGNIHSAMPGGPPREAGPA
jgi:Cu/Ag efflux pump CusA